jgi:TfoX/Sxy family transcriptional regulator of competence genes
MRWSTPSQTLLELLERSLVGVDFQRRKMFGQFALFLNGNMLGGVFEETIFLRYPPTEQEKLFEKLDEVSRFEPTKGRAMREYVVIPDSVFADPEIRQALLDRAVSYVEQLPPK